MPEPLGFAMKEFFFVEDFMVIALPSDGQINAS